MPLPTSARCLRRLGRAVVEPDQPRRAGRALADADDAAVAALGQRLLVQHRGLDAGALDVGDHRVGERRGRQVAGGGVDQVAGGVHAGADRLGPGGGLADRLLARVGAEHGDRARPGPWRPWRCGRGAGRSRRRRAGRPRRWRRRPRRRPSAGRSPPTAVPASAAGRGAGGPAEGLGVVRRAPGRRGAEAGQDQDAARRPRRWTGIRTTWSGLPVTPRPASAPPRLVRRARGRSGGAATGGQARTVAARRRRRSRGRRP